MVSMFTLEAKTRDIKEKMDATRKMGLVPAVYYGNNKPTTAITVPAVEFKKVWAEAGESASLTLKTPEGNLDVLIHDVQRNPVTGEASHVDFLVIDANKEVEVTLSIEFVGESPAAKSGAGVLVKALHQVEVKGLPKDIPHAFEVDLSTLVNLDDQILVKDIKIPKGLTIMSGEDEVIASITHIKEEVESAPVDLSAIEVEKKGKAEETETTEQ